MIIIILSCYDHFIILLVLFYLLGLHVIFLFGTGGRGLLRNEINDLKRASRVSGNLAPRVSGRKEVATEPARQISIMIMYGI